MRIQSILRCAFVATAAIVTNLGFGLVDAGAADCIITFRLDTNVTLAGMVVTVYYSDASDGPGLELGNDKDNFRTWLRHGKGNRESGALQGLPLGTLPAGAHTLKVSKREVVPTPPRLDVLCLTKDGTNPPNDVSVAALLGLP